MIDKTIIILIFILLASLPFSVYRMIKGPTIMDRVLSFDGISITIIAVIILLSMMWRTTRYLDVILIFSILGFFGTVMFSQYLMKTYPNRLDKEPEDKQ